jgi:hypothetical protein
MIAAAVGFRSRFLVHRISSTRNREPSLDLALDAELYSYQGAGFREMGCPAPLFRLARILPPPPLARPDPVAGPPAAADGMVTSSAPFGPRRRSGTEQRS